MGHSLATFAKGPIHLVEFDEKHDGGVNKHVRQTSSHVSHTFGQKSVPERPKVIPAQFSRQIRKRQPRKFLELQSNFAQKWHPE